MLQDLVHGQRGHRLHAGCGNLTLGQPQGQLPVLLLLLMVQQMMVMVNWRQLGQFRGRSGSMLMADDATGRGADHRGAFGSG